MALGSVGNRMAAALNDPDVTPEQASLVEKTLRENMVTSGQQAMKYLLLLVVFSTTWVLIKLSYVKTVKLLDIELSDSGVALLVLGPVISFSFYQFQCQLALSSLLTQALSRFYELRMKVFYDNDIDYLLNNSTFIGHEASFLTLNLGGVFSKLNDIWLSSIVVLFVAGPSVFLIWVCYSIIDVRPLGLVWSVLSSLLIFLLLVRTILVFVQWGRSSGR